mmetsp:Transcript_14402/g.12678  ORF Transcript_14402/g.12678 Transcript_14402/m.12678 type:complete len:158 (+) Transcript_14402:40-513(+)
MHRSSIKEGLTLYDSSLNDSERNWVRNSRLFHIITWVLNAIVIAYLSFKIYEKFESIFMGYIVFSVFALLSSIIYARAYKYWYGHNVLIYFILFIFIIINFILLGAAVIAEFFHADAYDKYKSSHDKWWKIALTIGFFFIPFLHSLAIIYLYAVRGQ